MHIGQQVEIAVASTGGARYEPGVIVARYPSAYDAGYRYAVKRIADGKVFDNVHEAGMRVATSSGESRSA